MILTIKGADFSSANIGTLSTFVVSKSIGRGASFDIPSFVEKNSSVNWVITLGEDYTFGTYSVTMGGEVVTPSVNGSEMTIAIANVTGNIRISVTTVYNGVEELPEPDVPTPDEPETPTLYTFTINPTPSNATVKLTASGFIQSGNSISVTKGTTVSYAVSLAGYVSQNGSVVVNSTQYKNVTLVTQVEGDVIDLGTLTDGTWIKMENGTNQTLKNWKSTDYILIPDSAISMHTDDITAWRDGNSNTAVFAFYDADKNFISAVDTDTVGINKGNAGLGASSWRNALTYDIPENAEYVRICWTTEGYKHAVTGINTSLTSPVVVWVKDGEMEGEEGGTLQILGLTNRENGWLKVEDGTVNALKNWHTSDLIEVPEGVIGLTSEDMIAFRGRVGASSYGNNTTPVGFYDENENYIGGLDDTIISVGESLGSGDDGWWRNSLNVTIPEGTKYVKICWTTQSYIHYTTGVKTEYTTPVIYWVIEGANMPETPTPTDKEEITFTVNDNIWFRMEDGSNVDLNQWKSTNFIEIPEGATAVMTDDITAYRDGTNNTGCIGFWDENQIFISAAPETLVPIGSKADNTHRFRNAVTLEIPENAKYMKACWEAVSGAYVHASTGNSDLLSQPVLYWIY